MSDTLKKVQSGQRLNIPAAAYNTFIDAARDFQHRSANIGREAESVRRQADIVLVRNDTGSARQQFDLLGIDGPLVAPGGNEHEFRSRVAIKGVTPAQDAHNCRFVIMAEPLAAGKIGKAFAAGVCQVRLSVDEDKDWLFAEIDDGECSHLVPSLDGSVSILWREGGTGVQWAIVRLGQQVKQILFGKPTAEYTSGVTIQLDPCDVSGESMGLTAIAVQAGWTLPDEAKIDTDQILPFQKVGEQYHAIGKPKKVVADARLRDKYPDENKIILQRKFMLDFGAFHSTPGKWEDQVDEVVPTGPFECPED
jgi:hypothetical protein